MLVHFVLLLTAVLAFPLNVTSFGSASHGITSNYDFEELHKYAHLSAVAYCLQKGLHTGKLGDQEDACPSHSCTYPSVRNMKVYKVFNFTDWLVVGSGFIAIERETKRIYVVFRGTSSTQDWISNFEFLHSRYEPLVHMRGDFDLESEEICEGCTIHKGFNTFIKTNGEDIVREVVKLKKKLPDYSIVVTGHSLGAALATLSGVEFRLLGFETLVVTLGGPKVGNSQFVDFVDNLFDTDYVEEHINKYHSFDTLSSGLIRATHKHDLIPMLPPTSHYKQCGYQYYLSAKGPHQSPETMIRRGTDYVEDDQLLDYQSMLPSSFSRGDHVNYFFKITGCQDL